MKTPEEIRKALECCSKAEDWIDCMDLDCPYVIRDEYGCMNKMAVDALEYIQSLEKEIAEYELLEKMRSNREHASGWIEFWRNKHGKSTLDIPDWDEVFKNWEQAHTLAESRLRRMKLFKRRDEEHLAECVQLRNKVKQLEEQIREITKMVPEWVSVEELLPGCGKYLCCIGFGYRETCYYYGDRWKDSEGADVTSSVTHWMPLPCFPEEEE